MNLQEFKNKYLGKQVEYHSYDPAAKYQCVDLANAYIKEVLNLTPIIGTHAKDFPTKYNKDEFDWIPNTPTGVPNPGDIIIWNGRSGGGYGHIAIVLDADVNRFTSLDQNWSRKQRVTVENHNYTNVSGWLRPKKGNMALPDNYADIVHNSVQWEEVVKAQNLGEAKSTQADAINTLVAGLRSRITDLTNQLGKAQAEASNEKEKASRLRAELLTAGERENLLAVQLQNKQTELETMAQSKGALATELAITKEKLATLEAEKGNGEYTLTIGELLRMILNQKITIRR